MITVTRVDNIPGQSGCGRCRDERLFVVLEVGCNGETPKSPSPGTPGRVGAFPTPLPTLWAVLLAVWVRLRERPERGPVLAEPSAARGREPKATLERGSGVASVRVSAHPAGRTGLGEVEEGAPTREVRGEIGESLASVVGPE